MREGVDSPAASEKRRLGNVLLELGVDETKWNRCKLLATAYRNKEQLKDGGHRFQGFNPEPSP